jgi:methionyl aminopeptidase
VGLLPSFLKIMNLGAGDGKKKKKKKKPKKRKVEQSDPPRVGLSKFFADGVFPVGEIQPYTDE